MKTTRTQRYRHTGLAALVALTAAFGSHTASAADVKWILFDGEGPFTTADNWDTETVPGEEDTAIFDLGGIAQIANGDDLTVNFLTVSYGGLQFEGGSLTSASTSGDVRIGSAGNPASLTMNGGTLSVNSSLRIGDNGTATIDLTDASLTHASGSGYLSFGGGSSGSATATFSGNSQVHHVGWWFLFGDGNGTSATVTFQDNTVVTSNDWTFFGKGGKADVTFKDNASFTNSGGATIIGEGNPEEAPAKLTLAGKATLDHQSGNMFPVGHNGGVGTLEMSGESMVSVAGEVYIGNATRNEGAILSHGTVDLSGDAEFKTVGKKFVISRFSGTGDVTVSGNAILNAGDDISVGGVNDGIVVGENGTGTLTISDSATVKTASTDHIFIGSSPNSNSAFIVADGTVNLNGGSLTATDANIILGLNNNNNSGGSTNNIGRLYLNGGTVAANLFVKGAGSAVIKFNGSTVKATASSDDYFTGFESADLEVQSGGLKFDTNGNSVGITQDLNGPGGLTKVGAGSLHLVGTNGFLEAVEVLEGSLVVEGALAGTLALNIANGAELELANATSLNDEIVLSLANGSSLILSFAGTETIGALAIDGEFLAVQEYTLADLEAIKPGMFSGNANAVLNVTSAVPEPGVFALLGLGAAFLVCRGRRRS
jgi:PEP-CTERM motif.